ncbi:YfhO family protein [Candidatus Collierbacteria bacterium]|nr:YfhO family protein [Candidatus Collierbacteria bacterium]
MKSFNHLTILTILTFVVTTIFYFKPIWKNKLIPFPGRLLVSYFSPWKEESWPEFPTGVPRKGLLGFDTARMMGSWRSFITNELKQGRLPTWNPHQFAGAPLLANFQSATFFPPNLIYLLLPFSIAWTILVIFQPLLASFGMYLLLKSQFKDKNLITNNQILITILPSLAYGFSAWMSVWIEWNIHGFVYALLPFVLLFIHKRKAILIILTISAIIFAGHPQMAFIALTAAALFAAVNHRLKKFLLSAAVALLITSVQWIPAVRYYQEASREQSSSEFTYEKTLLPWGQISQLIVPNYLGNSATGNFRGQANFVETTAYSGIAILGFAIMGLLARNKKQEVKFAVFLLLTIFLFVLPNPFSFLVGKLNIPILSTSVASRWLMLLPLAVTLLAAAGIDRFIELTTSNPTKKARPFPERPGLFSPAVFVFILIAGLWIYALLSPSELRSVSIRNLMIPSAIAGLFLLTLSFRTADPPASAWSASDWRAGRQSVMKILLFSLVVLSIGELILFGWKTMPYTEKNFVYPETPVLEKLQEFSKDGSRFASTDGSVIESNFATYYKLYDLSGYDALYPRRIGELIWVAQNKGQPVADFSRSTVVTPTSPSLTKDNLWNLAGVRWIINKDDLLSEHPGQRSNDLSPDFKLIWEEGKWQIYENLNAFPRAFFIKSGDWIGEGDDVISSSLNLSTSLVSLITPARIVFYQPTKVAIEVSAPADGYLVLTDTFYPGWTATVDGPLAEIVPAFHAFRAVPVSQGNHIVKFSYGSL